MNSPFQLFILLYVHWFLLLMRTLYWPDSLQPLFKHVEQGSEIREKIICFLRDKVHIYKLRDLHVLWIN
jgi:hypothetical protein